MAIWIIKGIGYTLAIYAIILGIFYFKQESLLFYPGYKNLEECHLKGTQYIANGQIRYLKFSKAKAQASLIVFHGNAGSACDRGYYIGGLGSSPVNIILAEYPGFAADKEGEMSERNFLENAQLIFDEIYKEGLPIFIYGESLGSGIATYIASQNEVKGLLLNHPYTSISDVGMSHYPFLPIGLLNKNEFPAKIWARDVEVSPIVFQGGDDKLIPVVNVEKQLQNFKKKPLYFKVAGAGHNNLVNFPIVFEQANRYIQARL